MDNLERIKKHVNQSDVVWFFSDIYEICLGIGGFMAYATNNNKIYITREFNIEYYKSLSRFERYEFEIFLEFKFKIIINRIIIR